MLIQLHNHLKKENKCNKNKGKIYLLYYFLLARNDLYFVSTLTFNLTYLVQELQRSKVIMNNWHYGQNAKNLKFFLHENGFVENN